MDSLTLTFAPPLYISSPRLSWLVGRSPTALDNSERPEHLVLLRSRFTRAVGLWMGQGLIPCLVRGGGFPFVDGSSGVRDESSADCPILLTASSEAEQAHLGDSGVRPSRCERRGRHRCTRSVMAICKGVDDGQTGEILANCLIPAFTRFLD